MLVVGRVVAQYLKKLLIAASVTTWFAFDRLVVACRISVRTAVGLI